MNSIKTPQTERFLNPFDSSHTSICEGARRTRLKKGRRRLEGDWTPSSPAAASALISLAVAGLAITSCVSSPFASLLFLRFASCFPQS